MWNCFVFQADATLQMEQRHFQQASLEYVCLLQQVQERKKFEFVETVSSSCWKVYILHQVTIQSEMTVLRTQWNRNRLDILFIFAILCT